MASLRTWRKAQKITLGELSKRLGMSDASLSRIERGEQWPDRETIQRIVDETNGDVSINDLFEAGALALRVEAAE
jgi:transcriptional regulator with XRE-family HTH domain